MSTILTAAQALSFTTSLILAGMNFSASQLTLPTLYPLAPSTSTPIFRNIYLRGAATLVPLGIFSASCSALVAYQHPSPSQQQLWAAAGVATISQLPWTLLVMKGTIDRLNMFAISGKGGGKEEVVVLLKRWAWMNFVRGGLAMVGGVVGVFAVFAGQRV